MRLSTKGREKLVNKRFKGRLGKQKKPCKTTEKPTETGVAYTIPLLCFSRWDGFKEISKVLIYTLSGVSPAKVIDFSGNG